jgi:transcriptional regulator with XRE-family HTH domain
MSATYQLFTEWKKAKGLTSDNQGALALGVTRGTVSLWKQDRNAEIQLVERMAKDIGEEPAPWAMMVMAERAVGEEKRVLERLAKSLVGRPRFELGTNRLKVYCSTD